MDERQKYLREQLQSRMLQRDLEWKQEMEQLRKTFFESGTAITSSSSSNNSNGGSNDNSISCNSSVFNGINRFNSNDGNVETNGYNNYNNSVGYSSSIPFSSPFSPPISSNFQPRTPLLSQQQQPFKQQERQIIPSILQQQPVTPNFSKCFSPSYSNSPNTPLDKSGLNSPIYFATNTSPNSPTSFKYEFDVKNYSPEEIKVTVDGSKLIVSASHVETDSNKSVRRELKKSVDLPGVFEPSQLKCTMAADGKLLVTFENVDPEFGRQHFEYPRVSTITTTNNLNSNNKINPINNNYTKTSIENFNTTNNDDRNNVNVVFTKPFKNDLDYNDASDSSTNSREKMADVHQNFQLQNLNEIKQRLTFNHQRTSQPLQTTILQTYPVELRDKIYNSNKNDAIFSDDLQNKTNNNNVEKISLPDLIDNASNKVDSQFRSTFSKNFIPHSNINKYDDDININHIDWSNNNVNNTVKITNDHYQSSNKVTSNNTNLNEKFSSDSPPNTINSLDHLANILKINDPEDDVTEIRSQIRPFHICLNVGAHVDPTNLKIDAIDNVLIIRVLPDSNQLSGSSGRDEDLTDNNLKYSNRGVGWKVYLPQDLDPENVNAHFTEEGLLLLEEFN